MYYYVIDNKINKRLLGKIENKLRSLNILGPFFTEDQLKLDLLTRFAEKEPINLIVIGKNLLINKIINQLANISPSCSQRSIQSNHSLTETLVQPSQILKYSGWEINLGIIPLEKNLLCNFLNIFDQKTFCKIISKNNIRTIDLCRLGNFFFATYLYFEKPKKFPKKSIKTTLLLDDKCSVQAESQNLIIANANFFDVPNEITEKGLVDEQIDILFLENPPKKGLLFIKKVPKIVTSIFHAKKIKIETEVPLKIFLDKEVISSTPTEIEIVPKALNILC